MLSPGRVGLSPAQRPRTGQDRQVRARAGTGPGRVPRVSAMAGPGTVPTQVHPARAGRSEPGRDAGWHALVRLARPHPSHDPGHEGVRPLGVPGGAGNAL